MTNEQLQTVREALDWCAPHPDATETYNEALDILDAALAQPEWTLPTPFDGIYDNGKLYHVYTEQQMREAYEAGIKGCS